MFYVGQILEQALLMYPLVLGIFVSFSVLKIADLTVDGSFLFGAAIFATLSTQDVPLVIAMIAASLSGAIAGAICALTQYKNRLDPLITGILMAFILHSLSLVIMARPNISLLQSPTIFSMVEKWLAWPSLQTRVVSLVCVTGVLSIVICVMLSTRYGLWLKAFGNNQHLVSLLGRHPEWLRIAGLALGNGLAAFSGCLTAQASGYADINMGFGQALIGIAMVLLGRELRLVFSRSDSPKNVLVVFCVFLGTAAYFILTNEIIRYGLNPVYLKMAIGIFLIAFLLLSSKREAASRGVSS